MDRRVSRTRRMLKGALLELILERDYSSITVSDIADRADVGRSTFYSHFLSKEDLLFSGFDQWLMSLTDRVPDDAVEGCPAYRFSLPLLRHVRGQRRFFLALVGGRSGVRVHRRVTQLIVDLVLKEEGRPRNQAEAGDLARASAVAGAFLAMAAWWLDQRRDLSAEEVDGLFQDLWRRAA